MSSAITVGALAVAEAGANAIGAVRLSLAEKVIEVELVRVAPYAAGFAPAAVVEAVRFTAPYTAVRGLVRRGRTLLLALDPRAVAPYNRFALTRFTSDPIESLDRAWRARARARLAAIALPVPVGVAVAAAVPRDLAGGAVGVAAVAGIVGAAAWVVAREVGAWLTSGGAESAELGEAFEADLSRRLGLTPPPAPAPARAPRLAPPPVEAFHAPSSAPPAPPAPRRVGPAMPADAGPAPEPSPWRAPLLLGLAALGLTVTIGLLVHLARTPPPAPAAAATSEATAAPATDPPEAPPAEPAAPAAPEPPRAGPPCTCARADSPLWADGLPALAVLVAPREGAPARPGKLDLDVAAVNDAARPLRDVRVVLTFWRRAASGKKLGVTDRGLFWSGDLAPGQAVRWRVRAPGTEYRVDASVNDRLAADPALEPGAAPSRFAPAPPDAFVPLAQAGMRPVRAHAATLLAWLRDPRALDAARDLGATSPEERLRIARLERAAAPVFACGVAARGDALAACVMNASTEPAADLVVREVTARPEGDAEADAGAPRAWPIEGVVPVHEGALVTLPLGGGPAPAEIEIARAAR